LIFYDGKRGKGVGSERERESEEDAEHIVAKAIHDGVIEATIDRKEHFVPRFNPSCCLTF
jgi:hypothetical protein